MAKIKMKTLNTKLENAAVGTRGLVRTSLNELRTSGVTSTGKNQNRKSQIWTKEVCEILTKNNIPFEKGNDAPKGGVCGEFVKLTSKTQIKTIQTEIQTKKNEVENAKLILKQNLETSKNSIITFINENKDLVEQKKAELMELKNSVNKEQWHVKANALIQMVCKNDFSLGWSNIYNLIKNN